MSIFLISSILLSCIHHPSNTGSESEQNSFKLGFMKMHSFPCLPAVGSCRSPSQRVMMSNFALYIVPISMAAFIRSLHNAVAIRTADLCTQDRTLRCLKTGLWATSRVLKRFEPGYKYSLFLAMAQVSADCITIKIIFIVIQSPITRPAASL